MRTIFLMDEGQQQLNELVPVNQNKSGFKRRHYTLGMFLWVFFVALVPFGQAMYHLIITEFEYFGFNEIIQLLAFAFLSTMAFAMLWCEVEDTGESLSVKFGPLNLFCRMGHTIIRYSDIKEYRPAQGRCEKRCGYGVGKVNYCVPGGLRQHALCGLCCQQKPVLIEFKCPQSVCGKRYCKILLALSPRDYQDFMQMLDRKFGVMNNTVVTI